MNFTGHVITGGSDALFANRKERGPEKFISRLTYGLGILFILISLILSDAEQGGSGAKLR